jgi:hypothetical protein
MKTKKPILRLVALAALSFFTGNEVVAQTNIGAACGCPAYSGRPVVSITTAGTWTTLPAAAYGKELLGNQNVVLTCDKTWTLDEKLYIGSGSTLTIQPGTVIKGSVAASAAAATALIIERGGKIIAPGVEECPIIFTALADALNGAYPVNNKGMWGGVLICGTASNNLTLALNGPFIPGQQGKLAAADGLGVLEGFASSYPQDQYGANLSGAQGYVSATSPASATYTFDINCVASGNSQNINHGAIGNTAIRVSSSGLASYALVGTAITGPGIPANTTVTGVASDVISISNALTAGVTTGTSYTFTNTYPLSPSTTGFFFQLPNTGNPPTTPPVTPAFANGTFGPFGAAGGTINFASPYIGTPGITAFNDDDNSGIMTYVSIRHSGANLLVGSEINGLTLASVGRGTKIEHIEIVSCADDNIEIFGGTVNLKYCTTLYGNDDMYDYDLGWTGKAQFLFGMKADHAGTPSVSQDNDNGFEADGGDNNQTINQSNPTIYNATILGNAKTAGTADNRALAAMNFKEGSKGTLNNSVFAHFKNGLNVENALTTPMTANSYHNWATTATAAAANPALATNNSQSLKVKCNTFIGVTNPMTLAASSLAATGQTTNTAANTANTAQFTADGNLLLTQLDGETAGFKYAFAINGSTNAITTKNDVVPNVGVTQFQLATTGSTTCAQAPMDGFFSPANYRGAFAPSANNENWLSDWTYSQVLNSTNGVTACPTDINNDGTTDVNDFLIFSGQFGQACN